MHFASFRFPPFLLKPEQIRQPVPQAEEIRYPDAQQGVTGGERRLAIVVPANNPGPDICKLVAGAIALGYPSPILINWGKNFSDVDGGEAGAGAWAPHFGKVTGTLEYLDRVTGPDVNTRDRLDDEDLVLILDAYDIWFQLPPSVLLHRYHESNKQANARLARQWGGSEDIPMQQTIIISAQKRCYPTLKSGSNLHCDALPESSLRPDIYGPRTDTTASDHRYVRPRYINSGSFMGPLGDMKRYFRRVKQRMERQLGEGVQLPGDQGVFGEILGEQEVWRQWRRDHHGSAIMPINETENEAAALVQRDFEYHLGLDYTQGLFLPTVYSDKDGDFVSLNNLSAIEGRSSQLGISPPRLQGVPNDVLAHADKPLTDVVLPGDDEPTWGDVPLYADFFTAAVPVMVHHNAWKHGLKGRRTSWWDRTWYFPHLRQLLELHINKAPPKLAPLARVPARDGHLTYFAPRSDAEKRTPRVFRAEGVKVGLEEVGFEEVCRYPEETEETEKHWYDEVFRDGKGSI